MEPVSKFTTISDESEGIKVNPNRPELVKPLFNSESVELGWKQGRPFNVGAGFLNTGNSCYLNATLQALFHVPALANWLTSDEEQAHALSCQNSDSQCVICSVRETFEEAQLESGNSIRPFRIANILSFLNRDFQTGRQQDAHEFLRCLLEKMTDAYLVRRSRHLQVDMKQLETTPLDQILGGCLDSTVRCGKCSSISSTKQHFQDMLLDVERSDTVDESVAEFFATETLDEYRCGSCNRKGKATKRFVLERPPNVLCVQLKRFSYYTNEKITKHVRFRRTLDLSKYAKGGSGERRPLVYNLASIVSHHGSSSGRGHYTTVGQAHSGAFYKFDDTCVREMPYAEVSRTNAYIMFYEIEPDPERQVPKEEKTDALPEAKRRQAPSPQAPVGYTQGWTEHQQKQKSKKKKQRRKSND